MLLLLWSKFGAERDANPAPAPNHLRPQEGHAMAGHNFNKVCPNCKVDFNSIYGRAVYCSVECRAAGRYPSIATRLAEKSLRAENGCLVWQAALDNWGYGIVRHNGRMRKSHRVAWELVNGPIPEDKIVCHTCDNPQCIEVSHLWLGTNKENRDDMVKKGRQRVLYGPDNPSYKLTPELIAEILAECTAGKPKHQIAWDFGLAHSTVYNIFNYGTSEFKGKK